VPVPPLSLADQFIGFGRSAERDGGTTYGAICRGVAADDTVLDLLDHTPEAQRRPNLLLAAVHFLLLSGADHPLARHYDSVQHFRGHAPFRPDALTSNVVTDFVDFCHTYREELLPLLATRSTQTNEVGRCAALLPAISAIASNYPAGQPLALLDLGTSAGLNLLFDHYAYAYRQRSDGVTHRAGEVASPVLLDCTIRNDFAALPPMDPIAVASRTGLDRLPIEPSDADGARWLLACLWPDNLPRFIRLQAALDIARSTPQRPVLHTGDIVHDLGPVAASIDRSVPLVVFHSWVAAYLTTEGQRDLVAAVSALADTGPLHYLYAESPIETPGLPTPPSPSPGPTSDLATALVHLDLDRGTAPVRLADLHPHGKWLQWWPPHP
jgi:hypothetical protein